MTYHTRISNLTYWGQQDYARSKRERKEKAEAAAEEVKPTPQPQPTKYQVATEKHKDEYVRNAHSVGKTVITTTPNTLPKDKGVRLNKNKVVQKDPDYVEKLKKNHQTTSLTQPKVNTLGQESLKISSTASTPSDEKKDNTSTTNEKQNVASQPAIAEKIAQHTTKLTQLETIIKQLPPSAQQTWLLNTVGGYLIQLQNPSFVFTQEFTAQETQICREVKAYCVASSATTAQKN